MSRRAVVITGFMGAGKTTVGRALARLLGAPFVDLDDAVRELEGRGPRELIDEEGEDYFREAETRALRRVLESGTARVVATGGGAWTIERNRSLVAEHGCLSVWLDAPFDLCLRRIDTEGARDARPFARDAERARQLYAERLAAYQQADVRVCVSEGRGAEELAAEIAAALGAGG
jgi:shikimate kinase